jgi:uncharacterized membrane protein YkvI
MRQLFFVYAGIAATYMGAVIGAGFATGQELMQFFVVFGSKGLWGVLFAGCLFILLGGAVIETARNMHCYTYQDFLTAILGPGLGRVLDVCIFVFLFAGLGVMLTGSGALFQEHVGLPAAYGWGLTGICTLVALLRKVEGLVWLNLCLIPIKMLIVFSVCLFSLGGGGARPLPGAGITITTGSWVGGNWLWAAILYVAYNAIISTVVLTALAQKKIPRAPVGGMLGGLGLGLLALLMVGAMLQLRPTVFTYQIPMLFVAGRLASWMQYLYAVVLWIAMVSTAVASGFGVAGRISACCRLSYPLVVVLVLVGASIFTRYHFAVLIGRLYPLFGYIGLLILAGLVLREVFYKKRS